MRENFCTTLETDLKAKLKIIASFEDCNVNDIIERVMTPYADSYSFFDKESKSAQ